MVSQTGKPLSSSLRNTPPCGFTNPVPNRCYAALLAPDEQLSDAKNDHVLYSVRRWFNLLLDSNPCALELLFTPADHMRLTGSMPGRTKQVSELSIPLVARVENPG